jgi:hypothetical protein
MKKALLLIALCFLLTGLTEAQEVRASVLEGCWTWNGRGEEPWFGVEVIFFGDIIIIKDSKDDDEYYGGVFFIRNNNIYIPAESENWEYRLSGNTLTLTDTTDGETATYSKARATTSPIEGIWKQTGGYDYELDEDLSLIFTRNIMAILYDDELLGFNAKFSGNTINIDGDILTYSVSGRTLTITEEGEVMIFTKIY